MSARHQRKASLTGSRSAKPAVQRRGTGQSHSQSSNGKSVAGRRRSAGGTVTYHDDDDDDSTEDEMAGMPQFCATCEKQIVSPGNSILYCSSACRKKDSSRASSTIPTPTSIPSASSYFDLPEPDIVAPRSPTILRPASLVFSKSSASGSRQPSDEDDDDDRRYPLVSSQSPTRSRTEDRQRDHRSKSSRSSTTTDGMPSLSHTPSSSVGTAASMEPALARRYTRSGSIQAKSVDLVMPHLKGLTLQEAEASSRASGSSARTAFRVVDADESD